MLFVCSSCSITRQTACPTFTNKTEKASKSLFSKTPSSKKDKKTLAKGVKKEKTKNNNLTRIEIQDLTVSSDKEIALNSINIAPSFIETKLQKIIHKKVEKKRKKILKNFKKNNQKGKASQKENRKQIVLKRKQEKKHKKPFKSKNNDSVDEREVHDLAILSLMAGILIYLTLLFIPLIDLFILIPAALFTIFALAWGFKSRKAIRENPNKFKGKKMALAGILLAIPTAIYFILLLAAIIWFLIGGW